MVFFLDFKWGQIFDKVDGEKFKVFVNDYKIKFNNKEFGDISCFIDFVQKIKNFLENENSIDSFYVDIKKGDENGLNDEMLQYWKQLLMAEENIVEFKIVISTTLILSLWKICVLPKVIFLNSHSLLVLGYVPIGQVL